jgi:hypothetical protein
VTPRNITGQTTTTTGTGTLTLGSAITESDGRKLNAIAAGDDGLTFRFLIIASDGEQEVSSGVYTHSGTTLTRVLESSTTGSLLNLPSGTHKVYIVSSATVQQDTLDTHKGLIPGGRLTLESDVPISTSDQTAKTTIYYTPYVHNVITLWDGVRWVPTVFAEVSLALGTMTADRPYDVFGYLSSGSLAIESLVWTSATARATAVTLQDGRYCKSGAKDRLLLGTFYSVNTTTTEDSAAKRLVDNLYNAVDRYQYELGSGTQNSTSTSYAEFNNGGDKCRADRVVCNPAGRAINASLSIAAYSTVAGDICRAGLSKDASAAVFAFDIYCQLVAARYIMAQQTTFAAGLNYLTTIFQRNAGTGTVTIANPQLTVVAPC